MSFNTWTPLALASEVTPFKAALWRMVEAQHVAATMKLVDSAAEQDLLEILIEQGKPPQPLLTTGLDYLLASPFRYPPYPSGSRFRGATDPGVFYGAETVRTACAELGYWRWRFLQDSPALSLIGPVPHTAFRTQVATTAVDLRRPPLNRDEEAWTATRDYEATQALGQAARKAGIGAIIYRSVRDPKPAWCAAIMTPEAFTRRAPDPQRQSWWLTVNQQEAIWRRESETFSFDAEPWMQ